MDKYIPKGVGVIYDVDNKLLSKLIVSRNAIKTALSMAHDNHILRDTALRRLGKIINKAEYIGWAEDEILPNGKQKHPDVSYWLYYKTKYGIINVRRMKDGTDRFYCIDMDENPNIKKGDPIR